MVAEVRPHELLTKLVGVGSPLRALFFCSVCSFSPLSTVISPTLKTADYILHISPIAAAQFQSRPFSTTYTFASQGY